MALHYSVMQDNRQRVFGPPQPLAGWSPPDGTEVFVERIPSTVSEGHLLLLFSEMGDIYQMRLIMDVSGKHRRYGFVRYIHPQDADRAVANLHKFEITPKCLLQVSHSVDNCCLFVANIPHHKPLHEVLAVLRPMLHGFREIKMHHPLEDYVLLRFNSHRSAALSRRALFSLTIEWDEYTFTKLKVDWARPLLRPEEAALMQTSSLYISNLPVKMSWSQLKRKLSGYTNASITSIYKRKNFAFVNFVDCEDAGVALQNLTVEANLSPITITRAYPPAYRKEAYPQLLEGNNCKSLPAAVRRIVQKQEKEKRKMRYIKWKTKLEEQKSVETRGQVENSKIKHNKEKIITEATFPSSFSEENEEFMQAIGEYEDAMLKKIEKKKKRRKKDNKRK